MHTEFCVHERTRKTILRAEKFVHANIKFAEPWDISETHGNSGNKYNSCKKNSWMSSFYIRLPATLLKIDAIKDTHREKALSNETLTLTKSLGI